MSKIDDIEKEIEKMINVGNDGSGFGDPDAEKAHNRRLQYLMNEKISLSNKKHTVIEWITVLIAILGLGLGIYQEFFKH